MELRSRESQLAQAVSELDALKDSVEGSWKELGDARAETLAALAAVAEETQKRADAEHTAETAAAAAAEARAECDRAWAAAQEANEAADAARTQAAEQQLEASAARRAAEAAAAQLEVLKRSLAARWTQQVVDDTPFSPPPSKQQPRTGED